ncbi:MAG: hypothetical protein GWO02_00255 [Gammaproteobacteria bacterium]|nr:hypothetical protein [Gammaproteobacteria bacterium]
MAAFASDGPTRCSGLPVMRYEPDELRRELGEGLVLEATRRERHVTPQGKEQSFAGCLFRFQNK